MKSWILGGPIVGFGGRCCTPSYGRLSAPTLRTVVFIGGWTGGWMGGKGKLDIAFHGLREVARGRATSSPIEKEGLELIHYTESYDFPSHTLTTLTFFSASLFVFVWLWLGRAGRSCSCIRQAVHPEATLDLPGMLGSFSGTVLYSRCLLLPAGRCLRCSLLFFLFVLFVLPQIIGQPLQQVRLEAEWWSPSKVSSIAHFEPSHASRVTPGPQDRRPARASPQLAVFITFRFAVERPCK